MKNKYAVKGICNVNCNINLYERHTSVEQHKARSTDSDFGKLLDESIRKLNANNSKQ